LRFHDVNIAAEIFFGIANLAGDEIKKRDDILEFEGSKIIKFLEFYIIGYPKMKNILK